MNLLCIKLQASYPPKNLWRFYTIRMGKDLFGGYGLLISYGRVGTRGREKRLLCPSFETCCLYVQKILHKRLHARSRIGVNYVLTYQDVDPSLSFLLKDV